MVMMQPIDMRTLIRDAWHEQREQVIRLRTVGHAYDEIADLTDLS